ncbi:MAG: FHA domain-containing protein, partial [Cyanobacteria bacterium]|nr:FHA domain-containing protein [Cyanobacteriota bacterium]
AQLGSTIKALKQEGILTRYSSAFEALPPARAAELARQLVSSKDAGVAEVLNNLPDSHLGPVLEAMMTKVEPADARPKLNQLMNWLETPARQARLADELMARGIATGEDLLASLPQGVHKSRLAEHLGGDGPANVERIKTALRETPADAPTPPKPRGDGALAMRGSDDDQALRPVENDQFRWTPSDRAQDTHRWARTFADHFKEGNYQAAYDHVADLSQYRGRVEVVTHDETIKFADIMPETAGDQAQANLDKFMKRQGSFAAATSTEWIRDFKPGDWGDYKITNPRSIIELSSGTKIDITKPDQTIDGVKLTSAADLAEVKKLVDSDVGKRMLAQHAAMMAEEVLHVRQMDNNFLIMSETYARMIEGASGEDNLPRLEAARLPTEADNSGMRPFETAEEEIPGILADAGMPIDQLRRWYGHVPWRNDLLNFIEKQQRPALDAPEPPLQRPTAAPAEVARKQSNEFGVGHEVALRLEDGFTNAGTGRHINGDGSFSGPRAATVVDRANDPVLRKTVDEAREHMQQYSHLTPQEQAAKLAEFVRQKLSSGVPTLPGENSQRMLDDMYSTFMSDNAGKRVHLGEFIDKGIGSCTQQAMLMKVLADELLPGAQVTLVRGNGTGEGTAINHMWTSIKFDGNEPRIYDPRNPGTGDSGIGTDSKDYNRYRSGADLPLGVRLGVDVETPQLKPGQSLDGLGYDGWKVRSTGEFGEVEITRDKVVRTAADKIVKEGDAPVKVGDEVAIRSKGGGKEEGFKVVGVDPDSGEYILRKPDGISMTVRQSELSRSAPEMAGFSDITAISKQLNKKFTPEVNARSQELMQLLMSGKFTGDEFWVAPARQLLDNATDPAERLLILDTMTALARQHVDGTPLPSGKIGSLAELLNASADYPNVDIPYARLFKPSTKAEAIEFYRQALPDLNEQKTGRSVRDGFGEDFEANLGDAIQRAIAEGKLKGNFVYLPGAKGSAADALGIDGILVDLDNNRAIPLDAAGSRERFEEKVTGIGRDRRSSPKTPSPFAFHFDSKTLNTIARNRGDVNGAMTSLVTSLQKHIDGYPEPKVPGGTFRLASLDLTKVQPAFGNTDPSDRRFPFPSLRPVLHDGEGRPVIARELADLRAILPRLESSGMIDGSVRRFFDQQTSIGRDFRERQQNLVRTVEARVRHSVESRVLNPTDKPPDVKVEVKRNSGAGGSQYGEPWVSLTLAPPHTADGRSMFKEVRVFSGGVIEGVGHDDKVIQFGDSADLERYVRKALERSLPPADLDRVLKSVRDLSGLDLAVRDSRNEVTGIKPDVNTEDKLLAKFPGLKLLAQALSEPEVATRKPSTPRKPGDGALPMRGSDDEDLSGMFPVGHQLDRQGLPGWRVRQVDGDRIQISRDVTQTLKREDWSRVQAPTGRSPRAGDSISLKNDDGTISSGWIVRGYDTTGGMVVFKPNAMETTVTARDLVRSDADMPVPTPDRLSFYKLRMTNTDMPIRLPDDTARIGSDDLANVKFANLKDARAFIKIDADGDPVIFRGPGKDKTYVNGKEVADKQKLRPGDVITIGQMIPDGAYQGVRFQFETQPIHKKIPLEEGLGRYELLNTETGQVTEFVSNNATIGRSDGNEIQLADRSKVSREHARIEMTSRGPVLIDRGSSNGTFINGEPVIAGQVLKPGDMIQFSESGAPFKFMPKAPNNMDRYQVSLTDGRTIPFTGERDALVFGRGKIGGKDVDVEINTNTVGKGGEYASGRHLNISYTAEGPILTDLGSTNGTFVNGERIEGPYRLQHGDRIRFGRGGTELTFEEKPDFHIQDRPNPRIFATPYEKNQRVRFESAGNNGEGTIIDRIPGTDFALVELARPSDRQARVLPENSPQVREVTVGGQKLLMDKDNRIYERVSNVQKGRVLQERTDLAAIPISDVKKPLAPIDYTVDARVTTESGIRGRVVGFTADEGNAILRVEGARLDKTYENVAGIDSGNDLVKLSSGTMLRGVDIQGEKGYVDEYGNVYRLEGEGPKTRAYRDSRFRVVDRAEPKVVDTGEGQILIPSSFDTNLSALPAVQALQPAMPDAHPVYKHASFSADGSPLMINGKPADFRSGPVEIGRGSLGLAGRLNDDWVSGKHGRIGWDEKEQMYYIEDHSTNGTWIRRRGEKGWSDEPTAHGTKDHPHRIYLAPGDEIRLGRNDDGSLEIKLDVPVTAQTRQQSRTNPMVDDQFYFDGKPLNVPPTDNLTIGRNYQS